MLQRAPEHGHFGSGDLTQGPSQVQGHGWWWWVVWVREDTIQWMCPLCDEDTANFFAKSTIVIIYSQILNQPYYLDNISFFFKIYWNQVHKCSSELRLDQGCLRKLKLYLVTVVSVFSAQVIALSDFSVVCDLSVTSQGRETFIFMLWHTLQRHHDFIPSSMIYT